MVIEIIKKVIIGAAFIETLIPALGVALVVTSVIIGAVLRYVFNTLILGLEEVSVLIAIYTFFVGAALASRAKVQIRVNIIDIISISPYIRHIIDTSVAFASAAVCVVFTYWIFSFSQWTVKANITIPPLGWPKLVQSFSLLLGLALMSLHHLVQGGQLLRKERGL